MVFSIENYAAKIVEKVSNRKYYFTDNGLLNLFLFDPETALLENLVAIHLNSLYDDVCFFNDGFEVDFYLWGQGVAIQVACSLNDEETLKREVGGLLKLSDRFVVNKLLIITRDERRTINIKGKTIEVVPVWQWLLEDVQVN